MFKVKPEDIKKHDRIYAGVFNLVASPILYNSGGETNWKKIAIGTGMTIFIGTTISGPLLGYSFETNREFLNIEPSKRLPASIKNLPRSIKIASVALAPFVSYALMQGIYAVTPSWDKKQEKKINPNIAITNQVPSLNDSLKVFTKIDSIDALTDYYSKKY